MAKLTSKRCMFTGCRKRYHGISRQKFCTVKCGLSARGKLIICLNCKRKKFVKSKASIFCKIQCAHIFRRKQGLYNKNMGVSRLSEWDRQSNICDEINKEPYYTKTRAVQEIAQKRWYHNVW